MKGNMKTLDTLIKNFITMDRNKIEKILFVYEERKFFIGDTVILFDRLKYVRRFFSNSVIEINFFNKNDIKKHHAILDNNPNIDAINATDWEDINFPIYDLILCVTFKEELLLEHLHVKYASLIDEGKMKLVVLSLSKEILPKEILQIENVFPRYLDLHQYGSEEIDEPYKLYITDKERDWADQWLENSGLKKHESLFIILDSTSNRDKMLNLNVHFDIISWILTFTDVKILTFDEQIIGKKQFYLEWLGQEYADRLIFSEGLELRQDFALISSHYTKLVLGPCTGLMHCAAGIYNNIFRDDVSQNLYRNSVAPLLITYTGEYSAEDDNIMNWWGNSPLVNCLMLRLLNNTNRLFLLHEISETERDISIELPCHQYTSNELIDFLKERLQLDTFFISKVDSQF